MDDDVVRDAELRTLLAAVRPPRPGTHPKGPLLTVVGAPGSGKTTLVEAVADRFAADGGRVLRAHSSHSESDLAFSGLHQLLRPVRKDMDALPPRQREALHAAFGLAEPSRAPDPMLIGIAALTLLSELGARQPLLVVVDDAQWADRASLDTLSFAARRLAADESVTLLVATRDGTPRDITAREATLELVPLDRSAAVRLLDLQPQVPTGFVRARVLDQAEGNPLALVELARATAAADAEPGPEGPLPVTDRLERLYADRLAALPDATRRAVVRLAAADTEDPAYAVRSWLPDIADPVWTPAEEAGLVRRGGGRLRHGHPLSRLATYQAAPAQERRAAHLELAELFREQDPDRHAWHLAAATSGSSARVSAVLEAGAERARQRSGYEAAAHMLERAAERHPDRGERTRLLAAATRAAVLTGRLDTVERLAARTRAGTDDPTAAALAALEVGRLMALTVSHSAAFGQLMRPAAALADSGAPGAALEALAAAAVVRFYSGDAGQLYEIERLLPRISAHPAPASSERDRLLADWVETVAHPEAAPAHLAPRLPALAAAAREEPQTLTLLAVAAWLLDETESAARTFDDAFASWRSQGPLPDGLGGVAALAYLEQGRWARAQSACADLEAVASRAGLDHAVACAASTDALLHALRGDAAGARARAGHALSLVDPHESRSVLVLAHRALGTAATAEGDHATAYQHYRVLFDDHGNPAHYHLAHPALPELAAAAARAGHRDEAARIVDGVAESLADAGALAPRRSALVQLSRAVLVPVDEAERHFVTALDQPALGRRPFERARAQLAYGEWLRRRRRIADARRPLVEAEAVLRRLGARPWAARAQAELRAAGAHSGPTEPDAFVTLTAQQQQIVRLAALGLTNREVAEKLYLSPRTVGSHLYRAFPKLGITARAQLRDVVDALTADTDVG
ncbi:helix-turn-helix transcriptional regulator [Streptomyces endophyticus]|uniref:AAA family ATPase n=1 Tax=Streptomyces endophyticus TaxID=714166 RepID=A0ABU6F5T6_9ACTN|nr:AAA family ATPase [Streptomyces endophyticus]MEB8339359.1 AAA family ATPase [Streptomyces endophyticus]